MNRRSIYGLVLMLGIIPIIIGTLACMPVPIGNPERSKVDPDFTGVWAILASEEESDSDAGAYVFEPFDKRTWLIAGVGLEAGPEVENDYDFSTYQGYEDLAANEEVHAEHVYTDGVTLYKAWLTKLAGEWFFTWEPKGIVDALGEDPELWLVFHVNWADDKTLQLLMVDGSAAPFKGIDKTRRAYERVLKKHANDPEIYGGDDSFRITLRRAEPPVLGFLETVAAYVIEEEG